VCKIDTALSFEEAKRLLEENFYDIAILDIMGVKGFELLEIANERDVPALMLTAHGLSEENLRRSARNGAAYYAPKEEITNIHLFVADVLEAREKNKSPWIKWFERLSSFYDRRFGGTHWREKEKEFWGRRIKALK
ncbi:MAG: response regulator, partial [Desulfobacteraceae bacterium]